MTLNPIEIPYKFKCRPYQNETWRALKKGYDKSVLVWHRGCGKDLFALNFLIREAIAKPGVYLHCFPNYSQAKRAIWKSIHGDDQGGAVEYLDHFPPQSVAQKNSSEMIIRLHNGSIYCLMGVDGKNAQRARGMNPTFCIMSEYAFMDKEAWQTIEPRVSQNKGKVLFISTPNGQNHFYDMYNHARANPDKYYSSLLTIADTKTLSEEHIESLRREGVPEDFIQQEYYCSFTRGAEGSYYGKLIQNARDEERLCDIKIDRDRPVYTSWDIGYGDDTAIWWFQIMPGGIYHFLEYYANSGEGLRHYIDKIKEFAAVNKCQYQAHYVPHDMSQGEFSLGETRIYTAREFGINMTLLGKDSVADGIQAVRSILPRSYFNIQKCEHGIKCLEFYRRKWNDVLKVYYDQPLHDKWSHGADSFRYAAMAIKRYAGIDSGGTDDDVKAINKYFGY